MAVIDAYPLVRYVDNHPDLIEGWVDDGRKDNWNEFTSVARRLREARKCGRIRSATMEDIAVLLEVHPAQMYGEAYWTMKL